MVSCGGNNALSRARACDNYLNTGRRAKLFRRPNVAIGHFTTFYDRRGLDRER